MNEMNNGVNNNQNFEQQNMNQNNVVEPVQQQYVQPVQPVNNQEPPKKEKSYLGLLIVFMVISLLLAGFIVYDKVINKDEPVKQDDSTYNKNGEEPKTVVEEVQIDSEKQELYDFLVSPDGEDGLYFSSSYNIENIPDEIIISFAMENYVNERKLLPTYLEDGYFPDLFKKISIKKSVIDEYIKKMFNTNRAFLLTKKENSEYGFCGLSGFGTGNVIYDFDTQNYSVFETEATEYTGKIYRSLKKIEKEGENLYFYDVAFTCSFGVDAGYECMTIDGLSLFDETKETLTTDNIGLPIITDAIFEKYKDNLKMYKHTFKKANDNYYWYSTEIVK